MNEITSRKRTAPAVLSRAGWIALPARRSRVAMFGVRQPCCRSSRACEPACGTLLTRLVTGCGV